MAVLNAKVRRKAYERAYYETHREEKRAYGKAYREAHREEINASGKAYREAHPEEDKARKKIYNEAHREENKAHYKAYYEANQEKVKTRNKTYRKIHKEKIKVYNKTYNETHQEEIKAHNKVYNKAHRKIRKAYYDKCRAKVLHLIAAQYGDTEPRCRIDLTPGTPVSDLPCRGQLVVDHINGGGRKENKTKGSRNITTNILSGRRAIDDLRILCVLHNLWNHPLVATVEP